MRTLWSRILRGWVAAGRMGRPRWVAGTYFSLGPSAVEAATGSNTPPVFCASVIVPNCAMPRGPREPSIARHELRPGSSR